MIRVRGLTKRFPDGGGIEGLDLDVEGRSLVALLGPSGCGKTTALRIVAGLQEPARGTVEVAGRDVTALPPEARNLGFVFQNYALFPHLTVEENVAYGLAARKVPRDERRRRAAEALEMVRLGAAARRRPGQLSGGEQQRVALARALVIRPAALLLDEPLSNLDATLRRSMREQLRILVRAAGIPALHVTHDQEEALAIADTIAVLDRGRLVQSGPAAEVFHRPATAFVARFLGGANVVPGRVAALTSGGATIAAFEGWGAAVTGPLPAGTGTGSEVALALRPEAFDVRPPGGGGIPARVVARAYLGSDVELRLEASGQELLVRLRNGHPLAGAAPEEAVDAVPDPARIHVMPAEERRA